MGIVLPKPILSKVVERAGNGYVSASTASLNGFRTTMEDAHLMLTGGDAVAYFGIFDGHSGDQCSKFLADHMPAKLQALPEPVNADALEKMCVELDEAFLASNVEGGSTATFCLVRKNGKVTIANVGDSRVLVCRGKQLLFQTQDHKPDTPAEHDRVVRCGGSVVGGRIDSDLAVSRAFGDAAFKVRGTRDYASQKVIAVPDVTELTCEPGDVIVLACDGVFEGNFASDEVCAFVHEQLSGGKCWDDLAVIACRVCDEAIRRGSKDNISCMIVQLTDGAARVRSFGKTSYVPGPPYPRNHETCRAAYAKMAALAGVSVAESLQTRYQLLQAYDRKQLNTLAPVLRTAFEMSDEVDVETERTFFGRGPAPGNEKAFFESLALASNL